MTQSQPNQRPSTTAEPTASAKVVKRELATHFSPPVNERPMLTFSPGAWLKLQFFCHFGETEIGAFGITDRRRPLYVEDVITIKQKCSSVTVEFDDGAVAEFFDDQVDLGRQPNQFSRIWLHTHPGFSPEPSGIDEETFERVFGRADWSIMFILARGGATYCRLQVKSLTALTGRMNTDTVPGVSLSGLIPVHVDYGAITSATFAVPIEQWVQEYRRNVTSGFESWGDLAMNLPATDGRLHQPPESGAPFELAEEWIDCFEELDVRVQDLVLDELSARYPTEPWDDLSNASIDGGSGGRGASHED